MRPLIPLLSCLITVSSTQTRIIGGTDVSAGTYPWFADAISGKCGGVLIAANWILTAAHCTVPSSYVIGALDYSDTSNGGQFLQVISVSQTFQHPLYGNSNHDQYSFDFRLNKLEQSSIIAPVDIDSDGLSDSYRNGKVLKSIGFGNTNVDDPYYPLKLQHVDIPYMTNDECRNQNYNPLWITDDMMCAGSAGYDACQGDSGGPLFDVSAAKVVGIVSWGTSCAIDGYPGVYARISNQFEWIKTTVCDSNQTSIKPSWCSESIDSPTLLPSKRPLEKPSSNPTIVPSISPSKTKIPTQGPSVQPTAESSPSPSTFPTVSPSTHASQNPSKRPSEVPSLFPSNEPTLSTMPSEVQSSHPSMVPSWSIKPTSHPSTSPSNVPSWQPTMKPSSIPSTVPTTIEPSEHPSVYYKAVTFTFVEMFFPISCPFDATQKNDLYQALVESIRSVVHLQGTTTTVTISFINDVICSTNDRHQRFPRNEGLLLIVSIQSISRNDAYDPLSEQDVLIAIQSDVNSNNSTIISYANEILDQPVETVAVRVIDSPSSSPSSTTVPSMSPTTTDESNASQSKMIRLSVTFFMSWIGVYYILLL